MSQGGAGQRTRPRRSSRAGQDSDSQAQHKNKDKKSGACCYPLRNRVQPTQQLADQHNGQRNHPCASAPARPRPRRTQSGRLDRYQQRLLEQIISAIPHLRACALRETSRPQWPWTDEAIIIAVFYTFHHCIRYCTNGRGAGPGRGGESLTRRGPPSASSTGAGISKRTTNRPKRQGQPKKDPNRGGGKKPDNDPGDPGSSKDGEKIWACQFYKFNPFRHCGCKDPFRHVSDVRQHLRRAAHQPPALYCPICYTNFDLDADRAQHLREQPCERPDMPPSWVSHQQLEDILQSSDARDGDSQEEKWFIIWDILFPNTPRPDSPYCTGDLQETVQLLRQYVRDTPETRRRLTENITISDTDLDLFLSRLQDELPNMGASARRAQNAPPIEAPPVADAAAAVAVAEPVAEPVAASPQSEQLVLAASPYHFYRNPELIEQSNFVQMLEDILNNQQPEDEQYPDLWGTGPR